MTPEELRKGSQAFAIGVIRLCEKLPAGRASEVLGKQLMRSATSVGAKYRAACRARSGAEFQAKLCIVVEEADETCYWLELLGESGTASVEGGLFREADELVRIFSASLRTVRKNRSESHE